MLGGARNHLGGGASLEAVARSAHAAVYRGVNAAGEPYCLKIVSSVASVPFLAPTLERLTRAQGRDRARADAGPVPRVISFGPVHDGLAEPPAPAGAFYLVTTWAPGAPLSRWLDSGWPPRAERPAAACAIASCAADLERLVEGGAALMHLDIKPSNIMLARDAAGCFSARLVDLDTALFEDMHPRCVPATPRYAAPEVLRPRPNVPITSRADVYALARVLAEVLGCRAEDDPVLAPALDPRPALRPSASDLLRALKRRVTNR